MEGQTASLQPTGAQAVVASANGTIPACAEPVDQADLIVDALIFKVKHILILQAMKSVVRL